IHVTSRTPPTFLPQAEDDPVDPVENSLVYYAALRKAGVPAEIHVYMKGGHAFGLRRTESPITGWPQLMETWLGTMGIVGRYSLLRRFRYAIAHRMESSRPRNRTYPARKNRASRG